MKKLVSLLLALAMVLTLAVSMTGCNKSDSTDETTAEETTTTTATETTTAYDGAFEEVDGFDATDYIGDWMEENAETGVGSDDHIGTELRIEQGDDDSILVSVYNYKATVVDSQKVTVENNQAELKTDDLTLSMTFGKDFVSLTVLTSKDETLPVGTKDVYNK